MFKVSIRPAAVIIGVMSLLNTHANAQSPYEFRLESWSFNHQAQQELLDLIADFRGTDVTGFPNAKSRLQPLKEAAPDARLVTGRALFHHQGSTLSALVFSAASREVFEAFMAKEEETRSEPERIGTADRFTLHSKPAQIKQNAATITVATQDAHYVYDSAHSLGLLSGHPALLDYSTDVLAKEVQRLIEWDFTHHIWPQNDLDKALSEQIQQTAMLFGVLRQRRDNESLPDYGMRREWVLLEQELTQAIWRDAEDVRYRWKHARPQVPFQLDLDYRAKAESTVASFLKNLIPRTGHSMAEGETSLCAGHMRFQIPETAHRLIQMTAKAHENKLSEAANSLLQDLIDGKVVDISLQTEIDRSGHPKLTARWETGVPNLSSQDLNALLPSSKLADGRCIILPATSQNPWALTGRCEGSTIEFQLTKSDQFESGDSRTLQISADARRPKGELVRLVGDFQISESHARPEDIAAILATVETEYLKTQAQQHFAKIPKMIRQNLVKNAMKDRTDFESMFPLMGDWSFDIAVRVSADGRNLNVTASIGPELYAMFASANLQIKESALRGFSSLRN